MDTFKIWDYWKEGFTYYAIYDKNGILYFSELDVKQLEDKRKENDG